MDVERSVLCKAISGRQLDALIQKEVVPEHFADQECREVFEMMCDHLSQYAESPGPEAVGDAFPSFPIIIGSESMDYYMDRFMKQVKRRKAIELYRDFGEACDDPERVGDIEIIAMEMASQLMEVVPHSRVGRWSEEEGRIEQYIRDKALGISHGMETNFPVIDECIVGLQPHELMVVAGWQNSGKSAVMQRFAWGFYNELGKRPLYISLEMSKEECYGRWASMATGIEHRAMRAMELAEDSAEFQKWREAAAQAREFRADRDIIVIDDLGSCTPDRVLVEARRYEPDVVFVDYLELMDPPRNTSDQWQGIDMIGKQLKRNARLPINGKHIPIVVGAQTNANDGGSGADLSNISYKSTGKHADIVLAIRRPEEYAAQGLLDLIVAKNRNGARGKVQECIFRPSVMFLHPKNMAESFERRTPDEPAPPVHRPADGSQERPAAVGGTVASPFAKQAA